MSTKIHHGRIMRNATLEKALATLVRIRPDFVRASQEAVAKVLARKIVFGRDLAENYTPIDEDRDHWSAKAVCSRFDEARQNPEDTLKTLDWDFTCSVSVIPHRGDVLMLTYWSNHDAFSDLIESVGFSRYVYQNSTDKPDSISEEEWESRRIAWDEALPTGRAVDVGFEFSLCTWFDLAMVKYDTDLIAASIPSEDARRERVAQHLIEREVSYGLKTVSEVWRAQRKVRALLPERMRAIHLSQSPLQRRKQ
ncbi:TPA: hypothetical protein L4741_004761 [Pseudomonas aeruginosa]|nr:hypothetical protein [Pseudomonas aeruginosa]